MAGSLGTVVIALGAAVSGAIPSIPQRVRTEDTTLMLVIPVAWTAADIGLDVSYDGSVTWMPITDDAGAPIIITGVPTAQQAQMPFPDGVIARIKAVKGAAYRLTSLNTGTGAAENQLAARSVSVLVG